MGKTSFTALFAAALVALTVLTLAAPPAEAGRGRGYSNHGGHRGHGGRGYRGGGNAVAAGIIGLGVGAIIGSALTPREVYVAPPPPRYAPVAYGPQPWSPDWYSYCYSRYRSFNPNTGTFVGYDGYEHFCR
jgi:hypothetical protein